MARPYACRASSGQTRDRGGGLASAESKGFRLYLEEVKRVAPFSPPETKALVFRVRNGDLRAIDEMAVRNLRLVVDVVMRSGAGGNRIPEQLEKGNLALLKAIVSFASSGKRDFRAYARRRIRREVQGDGGENRRAQGTGFAQASA